MDKMKRLPEDYNEQEMQAQFEESYEILCKTNEPFHVKMEKIYEFKREGYIPRMSTFISMCMGFNLDLPAAESLLSSLSLGFEKTDRLDCAYMFLLTHYQGMCIEDCNKILRGLGITEEKYLLGSFAKDERK